MRKFIAMLLVCLLSGPTLVFAAEPTDGVLMAAAVREAARLGHLDALTAQVSGTQGKRSGGHPVLIGMVVGAGVGAVLGAVGTSCSVPDAETRALGLDPGACGSHFKAGAALLGAGVGAGVGALIGLLFRH